MNAIATARFDGGWGNVELIHAKKVVNAVEDCAIKNLAERHVESLAKERKLMPLPLTKKYIVQWCSW